MTQTASRTRRQLREVVDLGEFTLFLPDETVESGAKLAAEVRAAVADRFMKLSPALSLFYDLDIEETHVEPGSRKSKNKPRLKKKQGRTLGQKIINIVSVIGFAIGVLSADYEKIPENLEKACQQVVAECQRRGQNVQIVETDFPPPQPDDA